MHAITPARSLSSTIHPTGMPRNSPPRFSARSKLKLMPSRGSRSFCLLAIVYFAMLLLVLPPLTQLAITTYHHAYTYHAINMVNVQKAFGSVLLQEISMEQPAEFNGQSTQGALRYQNMHISNTHTHTRIKRFYEPKQEAIYVYDFAMQSA